MTVIDDENSAFEAEIKATGTSSSIKKEPVQNYPGNSNTSKQAEEVTEAPRVKPVTKAVQKKKGLGKKISEAFTGDDMQSVGSFVLFDVIVPQVRDMVVNALTSGIERRFYGSALRPRSGGISSGGPKISYQNMYAKGPSPDKIQRSASAPMSNRARSMHDFSELIIENRGDAEEVIERLLDLIERYGVATVKDFYDLMEVTSAYTDAKWGWNDLRSAAVERNRGGGYIISLPPTREIE